MNPPTVRPEVSSLTGEILKTLSDYEPDLARDLYGALQRPAATPPPILSPPPDSMLRVMRAFFAGMSPTHPVLAAAQQARLRWRTARQRQQPAVVLATELIGPGGVFTSDDYRLGLFFQRADTFYQWHHHAAEEWYLPLSGKATWLAGKRPPVSVAPLSRLVWHPSWIAHAMQTSDEPLLAVWIWSGDIDINSYAFCPAPD